MIKNGPKIIAILGALGVILGAFGAHGLKSKIEPTSLASYQTGVLYHFIHTLAMAFIFLYHQHKPSKSLERAFVLMFVGIVLFSGSLYGMAVGNAMGVNLSFLGPITPLGGLAFVVGWVMMVKG
jgi:uncharacterized membrane protein YgdD (TMEM256/DUF423 family)